MQMSRSNRIPKDSGTHKEITWFVTFLLIITIGCTFIGFSLKKTILDADFSTNQLFQSKYINELYQNLNSEISNAASSAGVPSSMTSDLITKKQVKIDFKQALNNLYANKKTLFNTTTIANQVGKNIDQKAQAKGLSITGEYYTSLRSSFITTIQSEVSTELSSDGPLTKLQTMLQTIRSIANKSFMIGVIGSIILVILLLVLQSFNFLRWLYYLGVAGVWFGIPTVFVLTGLKAVDFVGTVVPTSAGIFSNMLEKFGNAILDVFQTYSLWVAAISFIVLIVGLVGSRIKR